MSDQYCACALSGVCVSVMSVHVYLSGACMIFCLFTMVCLFVWVKMWWFWQADSGKKCYHGVFSLPVIEGADKFSFHAVTFMDTPAGYLVLDNWTWTHGPSLNGQIVKTFLTIHPCIYHFSVIYPGKSRTRKRANKTSQSFSVTLSSCSRGVTHHFQATWEL